MKTLVIGASENPERYSYKAIQKLKENNHEVRALGLKPGNIFGVTIEAGFPEIEEIDTVTLYIGPAKQPAFYDYILKLKPRRVIFNPGTENPEFFNLLRNAKIEVEIACTLVLLATQSF